MPRACMTHRLRAGNSPLSRSPGRRDGRPPSGSHSTNPSERRPGEGGGGGCHRGLRCRKGAEMVGVDKDKILLEKEAELRRMQEMIAKMQAQMKRQGEGADQQVKTGQKSSRESPDLP